ncbi:MAG: hypothetical protein ACRCXY_03455 [Fusobacteriaceae bacterium]
MQIPHNARIYYSYPKKNIFRIYGKVGELLDVIYASGLSDFKRIEKQLNNHFFSDTAQAVTKTRLQIYQQYNLKNILIKEYTYQDILESDLSFESIRRSVNLGIIYRDHYWKSRNQN